MTNVRQLLDTNFPLVTTEEVPSLEALLPDLYGQSDEVVVSMDRSIR